MKDIIGPRECLLRTDISSYQHPADICKPRSSRTRRSKPIYFFQISSALLIVLYFCNCNADRHMAPIVSDDPMAPYQTPHEVQQYISTGTVLSQTKTAKQHGAKGFDRSWPEKHLWCRVNKFTEQVFWPGCRTRFNHFLHQCFLSNPGPALLSLPDHSCANRSKLSQRQESMLTGG